MPTPTINTPTKANKEIVICFRINKNFAQELETQLESIKPVGVRSPNQMARKVILDFLEGKLAYAHPGLRQSMTSS